MVHQMKSWVRRQLFHVPLVQPLITNQRFKVERELIEGSHHKRSSHQSIIHFSVTKAATRYTQSILSRCARENGLTHARIPDYAFESDFPHLDQLSAQEMVQYQHIFKPLGYLYSVFGGMIEGIPDLDDYYSVLMLRDPRDVLTSSYFSIAYSHPLPQGSNKIESFIKDRAFAQQAEIDQYVIKESERVCRIYQRYLDLLVQRNPTVYVTKYEDMISDFPKWLDSLLNYCELKISPKLKRALLAEATRSRPKTEHISKHMRQVLPGDHERKLRQHTIDHLNFLFADILNDLKYT